MAEDDRTTEQPGRDEDVAEDQPEDRQVTAQQDEYDRFADEVGSRGDRDESGYEEPAPELGNLHKDYSIPGVDPSETNPYRWHTGEKRDHGGEDAIEIIDVVK